MEKYTLLLNGVNLDTGIYEYFPFADKAISEFRNSYKMILSLKKEIIPEKVNEYIYARYCIGGVETNKNAIEAAYKASREFRYFPVSKRRKILGDIYKYYQFHKDKIIELLVIEGHPRKLAEWEFSGMERAYNKESLDLFKDELWKEIGRNENETAYWARKPDGVVCVSPPKNAAASNSMLAGFVFLGGNTLIIKPPLRSPISTIFLWKEVVNRALTENGAPPGTLNIVLGNSKEIMQEWLASPLVNDIMYFGDSTTGLEIGRKCFEHGKKPILELSGNDLLLIWKTCDLEKAIESSLDAFLGSTQICMVPKVIVIHEDIYDAFMKGFIPKVKALKYGLPSDPETCLTPVVKIDTYFEFLNDALAQGAKMVCGGERVDYKGTVVKNGSYIQPTVVTIENDTNVWNIKCVKEENFFPLLPIIKVKATGSSKLDKDETIFKKMVDLANANEYGLRTSVWVSAFQYVRKFIRYLDNSGLLRINSRHVDFSYYLSTHGGTGRTGGPFGEMNYVWQKTTHLQGISLTREKSNIL